MVVVNRHSCLPALGSISFAGALAGRTGASDGQGTLATYVSDPPGDIGDFDTLLIQIDGIFVKPEEEERQRLEADAEVDLTELVGAASELINETELDTGTYKILQLDAEATEATLGSGDPATETTVMFRDTDQVA